MNYDTAFCLGILVSLSAQVKTVQGRETCAVNSFAGGAPASFVTEAGSCVVNEAEHFKKGKDDLKINTAE